MTAKAKTPDLDEGTAAFERFRNAIRTIVSVRKADVVADATKARTKKKKPASHKG